MTHPTPEQLRDFDQGKISNPVLQARIEDHIGQCDACCALLREAPADPLLERLRGGTTTAGSGAGSWSEGPGPAALAFDSTVGNHQGSTVTQAPARRSSPAARPGQQPPAWLPPAALAGAAVLLLGSLWGVASLISRPNASPTPAAPAGRTLASNPATSTAPADGQSTGRPAPPPITPAPREFTPANASQDAPGVLIVIPHRSFWYGDYAPVREALTRAGIKTRVASTELRPATPTPGSGGESVTPDILFSRARPLDYAAVIFVGGDVSDYIDGGIAVDDVRRVSKEMLENGRLVTSLCAGNSVLAANNLLRGLKAARGEYVPDFIADRSGAEWVADDVVESGQIITGRDFRVARDFGERLAGRLLREAK